MLKKVGAEVRSLRDALAESQSTFAERVGLPKSRVSQIENGRANVTIRTLVRIAQRSNAQLEITIRKK
jgi:transcriptional regulator with XRE-family HTH domain